MFKSKMLLIVFLVILSSICLHVNEAQADSWCSGRGTLVSLSKWNYCKNIICISIVRNVSSFFWSFSRWKKKKQNWLCHLGKLRFRFFLEMFSRPSCFYSTYFVGADFRLTGIYDEISKKLPLTYSRNSNIFLKEHTSGNDFFRFLKSFKESFQTWAHQIQRQIYNEKIDI